MTITTPDLIPQPFAADGDKNVILDTPPSTSSNLASWSKGWQSITETDKAAGGLPPERMDFNGVLNELSAHTFYQQSGGGYNFDQSFATANGGYPIGATLRRSDGKGYWLNIVANNETDPEDGGSGWVPSRGNGSITIALSDTSATLTELQANSQIIILMGALTANINLIFPSWITSWTIINQCTGAYTVTCKTLSGTGIVSPIGKTTDIVGDGINITLVSVDIAQASIQGNYKNLALSSTGANSIVSVSYDALVLFDGANYITDLSASASIDTATTGAGGLDTGALAISTWYSVWRIAKEDGTKSWLISLSSTAPTMPSGYTFKARIGWIRTDSTANKYPLSFKQKGRKVSYVISGNVTGIPALILGVQGSPTVPTWVAASVNSAIPPTASTISLILTSNTNSNSMAAPSNSFGPYSSTTNPPPMVASCVSASRFSVSYEMLLETTNIYYAAINSLDGLYASGWTDTF